MVARVSTAGFLPALLGFCVVIATRGQTIKGKNQEVELEKLSVTLQDANLPIATAQGSSGGVTYIRWGHDECPKGTEQLYNGVMAGSHYEGHSGGSNFQCLPYKPEYALRYHRGQQGHAWIFGTEYYGSMVGRDSQNVPCSHCYVAGRTAKFMKPAGASCPKGWTKEYRGYLMTVRFWNNNEYSTYECVDEEQRAVPGSKGWMRHKSLLTYVEGHCDGNPCPPYDQQKELNCVVCTK